MSQQNEYDLIVVGCGVAGLSAAVSAAERGLRVLALERASLHLVEPRVTQLAGHQRQGALPVGLCGEAAVTVASAQLFQRPGQIIHRLPPVSWV